MSGIASTTDEEAGIGQAIYMRSDKIKVLHLIAPRGIGGAERVLITLASHVDREKVDLAIGVLSKGTDSVGDFTNEACKTGFPVETIVYRSPYDISQLTGVHRIARKYRPDIIHAHGYKTNLLGFLAAKLRGIPIVTTVHGLYQVGRKTNPMVELGVSVLKYCNKVLPVSEQIRKELLLMKVPDCRIVTIRNVPPVRTTADREQKVSLRKEMGIPEGIPLIGFLGRLEHVKGCDQLVEAIVQIHRRGHVLAAVIVGDGPEKPALESFVAERGLEGVIRFCGFRSDPERILQSLDLLVLPSRSEGIPLTLLEAMAQGVPIVASRVGGIPEVITHGVDGILVPPCSPQALAEAIVGSLGEQEQTARRVLEAKKTIETQYEVSTWAKKLSEIYEGIAA